ncbi:putative oxidoreductase [Prauserella isguenensis]|uniref:Putative oxidoreductase n=1 Tax=Prauserella isguenensis TaxID=1470180 RepID=A0A839S458_9PSEU|nr:DoxX family protein [Prauserella isguenensis]MBB3052861.1 putative oxidoreductase [Prauserella isguenensis]
MYGRIQDVAALIGRIAIGVVFLVHGLEKWNAGIDATAQMFEAVGIPLPTVAAIFVIAVEVVGALLFIVGFATPLVGVGFAVVGIGATFAVHLDAGLTGEGGYELVLVLGLAGLALGVNSGRLALDHLLVGRRRSDRTAEPVS